MSLGSEFKEFAMKGNVIDMAVGVIVGAAFGRIVSSLVGDVFMPFIGKLVGGFDFSNLALSLGTDASGKAVTIKYGMLLQNTFDFFMVAVALFLMVKGINRLKEPPAPAAPPSVPRQEQLLEQIRDLLEKQR